MNLKIRFRRQLVVLPLHAKTRARSNSGHKRCGKSSSEIHSHRSDAVSALVSVRSDQTSPKLPTRIESRRALRRLEGDHDVAARGAWPQGLEQRPATLTRAGYRFQSVFLSASAKAPNPAAKAKRIRSD